jgi:hypothetical protein
VARRIRRPPGPGSGARPPGLRPGHHRPDHPGHGHRGTVRRPWAIEVAFEDAKQITGAGEARNRTRKAVERTAPSGLYTQSIVIIWYHLAGHHPTVVRDRHDRAPWYLTKRYPSYLDMIVKLRRVLIAAQYQAEVPGQPTANEIRAVQLAWAQAAT